MAALFSNISAMTLHNLPARFDSILQTHPLNAQLEATLPLTSECSYAEKETQLFDCLSAVYESFAVYIAVTKKISTLTSADEGCFAAIEHPPFLSTLVTNRRYIEVNTYLLASLDESLKKDPLDPLCIVATSEIANRLFRQELSTLQSDFASSCLENIILTPGPRKKELTLQRIAHIEALRNFYSPLAEVPLGINFAHVKSNISEDAEPARCKRLQEDSDEEIDPTNKRLAQRACDSDGMEE